MARTDLSYEELIDYRPAVAEPADFDTFWNDTIAETRAFDLDMQLRRSIRLTAQWRSTTHPSVDTRETGSTPGSCAHDTRMVLGPL
jgi:cephalosporin-C deacetylase-like acetyl esterase